MRISLGPLESKSFTLQGGRFYYEKGLYLIRVKIVAGGDAREFDLYPGQGFNNEPGQDRFHALEITNLSDAESQDIDFEVSDRQKFDNRATIASTGDALPVVLTYYNARAVNKIIVPAGVATQVLVSDASRAKAALHFSGGDCFLGIDNTVDANDFPISNGSDWVDENTAALWVFSVSGCTVHVFEDLR